MPLGAVLARLLLDRRGGLVLRQEGLDGPEGRTRGIHAPHVLDAKRLVARFVDLAVDLAEGLDQAVLDGGGGGLFL